MKTTNVEPLVATSVLLAVVVFNLHTPAPTYAQSPGVEHRATDWHRRIATLEMEIAGLRQQIKNNELVNKLTGRWLEESWIRAGKKIDESQSVFGGGGGGAGGPVAWLLATDANSQRIVLAPEPQSTSFGMFSVDTSTVPAWIDFQVTRNGQSYPVRGIVRYTYQRAEIAVPAVLFDGDRFVNPDRPTSFQSTTENGYSVYKLVRESFKKTGVW